MARTRRPSAAKLHRDKALKGRPRRTVCGSVRDRHALCPMCGYPIDQTLDRIRHPLGSVVDEWRPRHPCTKPTCCGTANRNLRPGDPHNPDDCVEMHRCCNTSKHNHWPVTEEMRTRCRTLVEAHLKPVIRRW